MNFKLEKNFLKYFMVGAASTLLDWGTFYVFTTLLLVHYQFSVSLSFFIGAFIKFFLNKSITFKNKSKKVSKQAILYSVMVITSWVLSLLLMHLLVELVMLAPFTSRMVTTFVILFYGYFYDKNITYKL